MVLDTMHSEIHVYMCKWTVSWVAPRAGAIGIPSLRQDILGFKACFLSVTFSMPSSYLWLVPRYIYILMSCTCIMTHLQDNIYVCFCFVFQTEIYGYFSRPVDWPVV